MKGLTVHNLRAADVAAAIALQQRVYTAIPAFDETQFENLIERHVFVAVIVLNR